MTRKDELEERAREIVLKVNEIQPEQWDNTDERDCLCVTNALLQVERECWEKVINKIETELDKEHESTDDQIWEIRDWCRNRLKEVKG